MSDTPKDPSGSQTAGGSGANNEKRFAAEGMNVINDSSAAGFVAGHLIRDVQAWWKRRRGKKSELPDS